MRNDAAPFLSAKTPAATPTAVASTSLAARVRVFLDAHPDWHTARAIAAATHLTMGQANGAIFGLIKAGEVERAMLPADGRRKLGQTYRLVPR